MSQGFHRCQGVKGVSQAPGRLLHELVEQHVALTGCHLVFTDRRDPRGKGAGGGLVTIPAHPAPALKVKLAAPFPGTAFLGLQWEWDWTQARGRSHRESL